MNVRQIIDYEMTYVPSTVVPDELVLQADPEQRWEPGWPSFEPLYPDAGLLAAAIAGEHRRLYRLRDLTQINV